MGKETIWCCFSLLFRTCESCFHASLSPSAASSTSDVARYVFWSWCWSPWSVQLSLIAAIIKPFCYKPSSLKIIFFIYCTCQGRATVTFNDAGNPITANTNTPLQKGCRCTTRTCWSISQKAFFLPPQPSIKIWIFCRKTLSSCRQSLEQETD